ncbi:MAG: hybrid sensor histidine kinase/response regulator [Halobacteriaceae archaeon]
MAGTATSLDVLLVEDNPGDARLVEHHLNASHVADIASDVRLHHETSLTDGLTTLREGDHDILFLDLGLPESAGLTTLERVLAEDPRLPIVVLTGLDDRETAVTAIQRGAQDYILKDDLDADMLARSLRYAIERHRQEAELRRQNERLDKFASVVSHDLRNPLNVAKGRLDLARNSDAGTDDLDDVAGALDRMEALIDDLLTLARQGESIDTTGEVDLEPLVRRCWQSVETPNADLRVEVEGRIRADENRVMQLLENLLRNAVEHGSTGSRAADEAVENGSGDAREEGVTVTVGVDDAGVLYVADDGPGVPEGEREDVFETGYSTSDEGTGLGLMIVSEVVNAHDWEITVSEGEAGGARFEIHGVELV